MAIRVNDELVKKRIAVIRGFSPVLKQQLKDAQAMVRRNPSAFDALDRDRLPKFIAERENTWVRKIYITHGKHDYRLVYLHQKLSAGEEIVDYWYISDRKKKGYTHDPEEIRHFLIDD